MKTRADSKHDLEREIQDQFRQEIRTSSTENTAKYVFTPMAAAGSLLVTCCLWRARMIRDAISKPWQQSEKPNRSNK